MTKAQIVARVAEDKRRKAELEVPVVPVNGHAATVVQVTFSEAQRRKELALARIREAEADHKTGALIEAM